MPYLSYATKNPDRCSGQGVGFLDIVSALFAAQPAQIPHHDHFHGATATATTECVTVEHDFAAVLCQFLIDLRSIYAKTIAQYAMHHKPFAGLWQKFVQTHIFFVQVA